MKRASGSVIIGVRIRKILTYGHISACVGRVSILDTEQIKPESVGAGFPNPLGEVTSPLRGRAHQQMTEAPRINVNAPLARSCRQVLVPYVLPLLATLPTVPSIKKLVIHRKICYDS